jgi:hypothetical protein
METRVTDELRKLTEHRKNVLDKVRLKIPHGIFEQNVFFHSFVVFNIVLIVFAIFGQLRALVLFSFHPILMSVGCLVFIAQAIVAQSNTTLVDVLGPLMQHGKKAKVRAIHQNLNTIGAFFLLVGLVFMFANKYIQGKSLIPQTLHALLGWVSLLLVCAQGYFGMKKMEKIADTRSPKIHTFHGDMGLLTWDLLCLTVVLGMLEFLTFSLFHLVVETSVVCIWWIVHLQVKKKNNEEGSSPDLQELQSMINSPEREV